MLVWGEASISSSGLHLFDLISQKTGKEEGGKWKTNDMAPYSNFYKALCFSAGSLTSTTEAKGYTSAMAFSEALTTAHE